VLYFSPERSETEFLRTSKTLAADYRDKKTFGQLEIDKQPYVEELKRLKANRQEGVFMATAEEIREEPGLHALKLGIVMSYDILTKMKDMQSFVQFMQMLQQLLGRHALACCWYLQYITDSVSRVRCAIEF